jgi:glycosyltransferase involved in cell wall biosynthesis
MARIRVLRIIARMNVGGPAVQVSNLMRDLPQDKFEQVLVTGFCEETEVDFIESQAPDLPVARIAGLGRSIRPTDDLRAFLQLVRHIHSFRPHIIHTHTAKAGVLGRLAAGYASKQHGSVHTFHGHLLHGYFTPRRTTVITTVERFLARRSTYLIAVGEKVRADLLGCRVGEQDQFRVIRPGLDAPLLPSSDEARDSLGLRKIDPVVTYLGRLTRIKRPDRFLDMAAIVLQDAPNAQFVIAGDGDLSGDVRSEVRRRGLPIHLLGMRPDVETILAASDAVVLTSDNEGTPLSLIQAGLAGLPTVTTDVGSVREVVRDGETGWVVDASPNALALAVRDLLTTPSEALARGSRAKVHLEREFSKVQFIDRHIKLYEEVARQLSGI